MKTKKNAKISAVIKCIAFTLLLSLILPTLASCAAISGGLYGKYQKYEDDPYDEAVEFKLGGKIVYWDEGKSFEGTYKINDDKDKIMFDFGNDFLSSFLNGSYAFEDQGDRIMIDHEYYYKK